MSYKSDRAAEDIRREITAILRELKDPRVTATMLTVVRVEIAHDLSFGKVYISSLNGIEGAKNAVSALNTGAKGYIRTELSARLRLRKAPDLKFIADDSVEKGIEMFRKLNQTAKREEENED